MAATMIGERYKLKKSVSKSNMSEVWTALDMDEGEMIALKLLKELGGSEKAVHIQETIFNREVEILKKLEHINIENILDYGKDDVHKCFYIALQYVSDISFSDVIKNGASYTLGQKLSYFDQALEGVEYLHSCDVIHRDLKPSNIMLVDEEEIVKIIDFGISKLKDTFYSDITVANFSTPKYAAPEQKQGKNATEQSDIYSLGLIFYELMSEKKLLNYDVNKISYHDIKPEIAKIIKGMLQEDTKTRYKSVREIRRELKPVIKKYVEVKTLYLKLTKRLVQDLYNENYIDSFDMTEALNFINGEFGRVCYFRIYKTQNDEEKMLLFSDTIEVLCKKDSRKQSDTGFVIVGLQKCKPVFLLKNQEIGYEVPYNILARTTLPSESDKVVNVSDFVYEARNYIQDKHAQETTRASVNEMMRKWNDILRLEIDKLEKEKLTVRYNKMKIRDDDAIEFMVNEDDTVEFQSDAFLEMTLKNRISQSISVGYMRSFINNKMIVDLKSNVNPEDIATSGEVSLDLHQTEVALQRQSDAMKHIKYQEIVNPNIGKIIFDPSIAKNQMENILSKEECLSSLIDDSKLQNLQKALSRNEIFILQGPPGTGKTTFITEMVYQILKDNPMAKILLASQSHVAVDNALVRIKEAIPTAKVVRIGRKENLAEDVYGYTLDSLCEDWIADVIEKCDQVIDEIEKTIGVSDDVKNQYEYIEEIEKLKDDLKKIEKENEAFELKKKELDFYSSKWEIVEATVQKLTDISNKKIENSSSNEFKQMIVKFVDEIRALDTKFTDIVDDVANLSEELARVKAGLSENKDVEERKKEEIKDWMELLEANDDEEYRLIKNNIEKKINEKNNNSTKYKKIISLCNEWKKEVKHNNFEKESLMDTNVVASTCLGIASLQHEFTMEFDWVIIDEAGKSTPAETLVPICLGKRIVLIGDHKQLPPVVDDELLKMTKDLSRNDLETSLFYYLEQGLPDECKGTLNIQYRMNPVIGDLISKVFYDGTLKSGIKKEDKMLPIKRYENRPLVWLSTSNRDDREEQKINLTYRNSCELKIIFDELLVINKELSEQKIHKEVGVIAAYKAQVNSIRNQYESRYRDLLTNLDVEINSVDAFQGREKDIIFYSVVRSNKSGNLGFLKDTRRLNVAFSRARELLVVIGDSKSVTLRNEINKKENPFITIIAYIKEHGNDCLIVEV